MELIMESMENNIESYKESDAYRETNYKRAEKRIKEIKGFYKHLVAYCLFIPFIIFINYHTYWDYHWFWFSIIGWGIGISFHWFAIFVLRGKGFFGRNWEQRKIEQFMREEAENKKWD